MDFRAVMAGIEILLGEAGSQLTNRNSSQRGIIGGPSESHVASIIGRHACSKESDVCKMVGEPTHALAEFLCLDKRNTILSN